MAPTVPTSTLVSFLVSALIRTVYGVPGARPVKLWKRLVSVETVVLVVPSLRMAVYLISGPVRGAVHVTNRRFSSSPVLLTAVTLRVKAVYRTESVSKEHFKVLSTEQGHLRMTKLS